VDGFACWDDLVCCGVDWVDWMEEVRWAGQSVFSRLKVVKRVRGASGHGRYDALVSLLMEAGREEESVSEARGELGDEAEGRLGRKGLRSHDFVGRGRGGFEVGRAWGTSVGEGRSGGGERELVESKGSFSEVLSASS
jgi:hypothetical protein